MNSLFNTQDNQEFLGIRSDASLNKANKKGTPQYEEWLRKYREKRAAKPEEAAAAKEILTSVEIPTSSTEAEGVYSFLTKKDYIDDRGFDASPEAEKKDIEKIISTIEDSDKKKEQVERSHNWYIERRKGVVAPRVAAHYFSDKNRFVDALNDNNGNGFSSSLGGYPTGKQISVNLGIPREEAEAASKEIRKNIGELEADEWTSDNTGEELYGEFVSLHVSNEPGRGESFSYKLSNGAYLIYEKDVW